MHLTVIDTLDTDTKANLNIEENLLSTLNPDEIILRFWINDPSIIMGRFQNENFEISKYAKDKKVQVFKRLSGGGTVYHDHGNLNISIAFAKNSFKNLTELPSNTLCTSLIKDSLINLGFNTEHDTKRNALFIDGKKILGSAASIKADKYLFHCSLLVSTDLQELNKVLEQNPDYSLSSKKIVESVRSTVINLTEVDPTITMDKIKSSLKNIITNFIS